MFWRKMSSGNWTFDDTHTDYCNHGTYVDLWGVATILVTTNKSTSGSLSISALESAGFSVEQSTDQTYYARKQIDINYSYSVVHPC